MLDAMPRTKSMRKSLTLSASAARGSGATSFPFPRFIATTHQLCYALVLSGFCETTATSHNGVFTKKCNRQWKPWINSEKVNLSVTLGTRKPTLAVAYTYYGILHTLSCWVCIRQDIVRLRPVFITQHRPAFQGAFLGAGARHPAASPTPVARYRCTQLMLRMRVPLPSPQQRGASRRSSARPKRQVWR